MLQEDKMIFPFEITDYLANMKNFITNRLANINSNDHVDIDFTMINGRPRINYVAVNIQKQKYHSVPTSEYSINIKEKVYPFDENNVFTHKFKYEIKNDNDINDFVRFDFFNYDEYPPLHINACEEIWGNHLTYPDTTNLNLQNLDSFKAMSMFEKFIHHPDDHLLNEEKNAMYVSIIN